MDIEFDTADTPAIQPGQAVYLAPDGTLVPAGPITSDEGPLMKTDVPLTIRPIESRQRIQPREPRHDNAFYFDLETVPDEQRLASFGLEPLPQLPPITPVSELPDPADFVTQDLDAIRKFLAAHNPPDEWLDSVITEEQRLKKPRKGLEDAVDTLASRMNSIANAADDRRLLLSVTPEFCRIAAFGWGIGGGDVNSTVCHTPEDEARVIDHFWNLWQRHSPIVGFNVLSFDLPVIFARSAILGIPASRPIDLKPWGKDVVDLYAIRFPKMKQQGQPGKLKELAPLYGIPVPAGDVDGSQVAELLAANPEKLGRYVRSDVEITRELHRRWRGLFCQ